MSAAADLRRHAVPDAVRGGEIRPVFQPIVSLRGGTLAGFEVLARWNSPAFGVIAPETFIPWAEEDGFINALTHEIVSLACAAAAEWCGQFFLCFNVSPLQFNGDDLESVILSAVDRTGFSRHRLVMEMTESASIAESRDTHAIIARISRSGVRLALDDFGTGYAGLDRLLSFPFHALKIDRSFVRAIETDTDTRTVVAAIVGLAASLGLEVVAEGVEEPGQLAVLRALGCTYGQGWLLGREMSPPDAARFARCHTNGQVRPDLLPPRDSVNDESVNDESGSGQNDGSVENGIAPGLDALFGIADVRLCLLDPLMRVVRANETFAALFRSHAGALAGREAHEALPADLAQWLDTHAARISACDDTFVFSLIGRNGRASRLRIRRLTAGNQLTGVLLMAVPN